MAYRITYELAVRYSEPVTVILPSRKLEFGPKISALRGVRVLERAELDTDAFIAAGVDSARALALVRQDDLGNFHAALRATELNPALRIVLAVFNPNLGERIRRFFSDCAVLSGTAMSAPYFVAAALGQPAPSHVRVSGRTLYVARREQVRPSGTLCTLAELTSDPLAPRLLPLGTGRFPTDLVLAVADGTPRNPLTKRRNPLRLAMLLVRRMGLGMIGVVFLVLLGVIVAGFALLELGPRYSASDGIYLTLMDLTGSALTNVQLSGAEKLSQMILTVDGMAFIPLVTALVVGARLRATHDQPQPRGDHVIVVGLGNVGTRVVGQLHDLGFDVACVDRDPNARGIPMARKLGLPVILGEAYLEETLRAAGLETCAAVVSVTSTDAVNLETALHARALREDIRIVIRLGDDDLAQRLQKTLGNTVSRSVSYLAAPAFAAALLDHQVLRTIAVGRHVLLIAELLIDEGSRLNGQAPTDAELDGQARVLAVQRRGQSDANWDPDRQRPLEPGDAMIIIATRAGLGTMLSDTAINQ